MATKGPGQTKKRVKVNPTVQAIYDRTIEWGEQYGIFPEETGSKKKGLSKKAKNAVKILDRMDLGCRDEGVRNLISVLLEEQIPSKKKKSSSLVFSAGTVLIPKSRSALNDNSDIGIPYLITKITGEAISIADGERVSAKFTNHSDKKIELPTMADIKHLLSELSKRGGKEWIDVILGLLDQ